MIIRFDYKNYRVLYGSKYRNFVVHKTGSKRMIFVASHRGIVSLILPKKDYEAIKFLVNIKCI